MDKHSTPSPSFSNDDFFIKIRLSITNANGIVFQSIPILMANTNFFSDKEQTSASKEKDLVIPVIEETVSIGKTVKENATLKVTKEVTEENETVDVSLLSDDYTVEHVAVNRYEDEAPKVRQEGDTLIVPVVKEVLVKRLLVVEEIRITKRRIEHTEQHNVRLRKETVKVERNEIK